MSKNNKKIVVSFAGGIGDAMLLIPLINAIRKLNNCEVVGVFTQDIAYKAIKHLNILDKYLLEEEINYLDSRILYADYYYSSFLFSKKVAISALISLRFLVALYSPIYGKPSKFRWFPNIKWIRMNSSFPIIRQNSELLNGECELINDHYHDKIINRNGSKISGNNLKIAIQFFSDEGYKSWSFEKWLVLINSLIDNYPQAKVYVLGTKCSDFVNAHNLWRDTRIVNLIGKTNISQLLDMINECDMFVGLDSGLMHIAAYYNKPTFTLWGATDRIAYGYESFDPNSNVSVSINLSCSPCESPLQKPIHIRFDNPKNCLNKECMNNLSSELVVQKFSDYMKSRVK